MAKAERIKQPTGEVLPKPTKNGRGIKGKLALWGSALAIAGASVAGGIAIKNKLGGEPSPDQNLPGAEKVIQTEAFDPNATKGVLIPGVNATTMTLEQYEKLNIDPSNRERVTMGIPIMFPDGTIPTIKFERLEGQFGRRINVVHHPNDYRKDSFDREERVRNAIRLSWTGNTTSEPTIFFAPEDGKISFIHDKANENPDGSLKGVFVFFNFKKQNDNFHGITISPRDIKPLIHSPTFEETKTHSVMVEKGTPIFSFTNSTNTLVIYAVSFRTDEGIKTEGPQEFEIATTTASGRSLAVMLTP